MPTTPIYDLPFEDPSDQPGITLHGGTPPSSAILAEAVEGELERIDNTIAQLPVDRAIYTSGGTFEKGDFPDARMVDVQVQGGGGAGGGAAATSASQGSAGAGGEAGAYGRSLIPVGVLSASETVTVGNGGAGNAGSSGNAGELSSFGTHITAAGGAAGGAAAASGNAATLVGAQSTQTVTGDLQIPGQGGMFGIRSAGDDSASGGGSGGSSVLGSGGRGVSFNNVGAAGRGYGGAGGGAANNQNQSTRAGGAGAPGVVIIDVYR